MNIEHKPGVICVVIGAMTEQGRRHIGKQVELVKTVMPQEEITFSKNQVIIFTGEKEGWLVKGKIVSSMAGINGFAFFQQRHLMPIKDPDQDFVEDQKYKLIATLDGKEIAQYARMVDYENRT